MTTTRRCPTCASTTPGESLARWDSVPTHSTLLVDTAAQARGFPRGAIDLMLCHQCGFIGNAQFAEDHHARDHLTEDSQACSPTFVAYGQELARAWVDDWQLHDQTVVEIGAGRGDFSRMLVAAGAGQVIAMDPTIQADRMGEDADGRVLWRAETFDRSTALPDAAAVTFRHVLEHIAQPGVFLTDLHAALVDRPDVPVLIEIPEARRILREGAFWDVFYEHCAYFTAESAQAVLERCGFSVEQVSTGFAGQYLLIVARARSGTPPRPGPVARELIADARAFGRQIDVQRAHWQQQLDRRARAGEDVVLWGSGSKSTGFISLLGEHIAPVSRVVDVNPAKHGQFMLGSGHPIVAPQDLLADPPALVVVMNPIYLEEIRRTLHQLGVDPDVVALGQADRAAPRPATY